MCVYYIVKCTLEGKMIHGKVIYFPPPPSLDSGNDDPQCLCPFFNPRLECSTPGGNTENGCGGAEPYSNTTQTYACNQLNADKGGVDGDLRT